MKLNLGCGHRLFPEEEGWINVDLDPVGGVFEADVRNLPWKGEADLIFAGHLLEHFRREEADSLLRHWKAALKPGGTLDVIVPDMLTACRDIAEHGVDHSYGNEPWMNPYALLWGYIAPGKPLMAHMGGFSAESLGNALVGAGFEDVEVQTGKDDWCPAIIARGRKPVHGRVDMVVPCWNHAEMTKGLLESIVQTRHPYRMILIDNGSTDETPALLLEFKAKHPETILIRNEENLGFVKATNQGLEASDSPYVMLLNNDVEILPGDTLWLDRMLEHFGEDVGAVGPTSTWVMGFQKNELAGFPRHHIVPVLSGFAMLVRQDVVKKIGVLDEVFGMGGNDDLDYSFRIQEAGYNLVVARDVFVLHEGSVSLKTFTKEKYEMPEEDMRYVEWLDQETRDALIEKWGQERIDTINSFYECFTAVEVLHI